MKLSLIAAISENNVIGKDNKLPWHIPEDLQRFHKITTGHPIIMGRKTYDSIGRPLPGRLNIVITRDSSYKNEAIKIVHSLDEAINIATQHESLNQSSIEKEIFVIGGGQVFRQAIEKADKLYLTIVHITIDGDAQFPDFSQFPKKVFEKDGESNGYTYTFVDLEK